LIIFKSFPNAKVILAMQAIYMSSDRPWADFTILDRNIMTIPEDRILETKVIMTIIGGEKVFDDKNTD
jgi:hypothetical protein